MENYYYINVAEPSPHAKYGVHHSKIILGDCVNVQNAIEKFRFYKNLLPENFNLSLHYFNCSSREIEWVEKKDNDDIGYDF